MGLTKDLQKQNAGEAQVVSSATQPVAVGGYNAQNIPQLAGQQPAPMSVQEVQHVRQVAQQANMETNYLQNQPGVNPGHLQKPTVPLDGINPEISALVTERMWRIVCVRNLYNFYTNASLQTLVNRACKHDWRLIQTRFGIPTVEEAVDMAVMGLYDIVFFIDDSGSMDSKESSEDGMKRWETSRQIVAKIAFIATMMDSDGVLVRAFNDPKQGNGLSTVQLVDDWFNGVNPSGGTPSGSALRDNIITPIVKPMVLANELQRPVLIITVTDGEPNTSPIDEKTELERVLTETKQLFRSSKYGEFGISFSFVQVGVNEKATEFLGYLDEHPVVGNFVDCTSSYAIEKNECEEKYRKQGLTGKQFTQAEYVIKLMIGSIDPVYDAKDESGRRTAPQSGGFMSSVSNVFGWGQQPPPPPAYAQQYGGQQGQIPMATAYPVPNNQYGNYNH